MQFVKELLIRKGSIAAICLSLILTAPRLLAQNKGNSAKGKQTFKRCAVCHDANSSEANQSDPGPDELTGPGLKGLFKRQKLRNGKKVTEENVREFISGGGNGMPAFAEILSKGELDDVIAFLKTL